MKQICIVTPDIIGPVKNGGIGTHCHHLAQRLAAEPDTRVSILFTGPFEVEDAAHWSAHYARSGIEFVALASHPLPDYPHHGGEWFVARALQVHEVLAARHFDVVHFQEWQANGFMAIQAKRLGVAHQRSTFVVTMHSSSEWIREGMRQLPALPVQDAKLDYMERYCCEFADRLISPSHAMFAWAEAHGWPLKAPRSVVPYCMPAPPAAAAPLGAPDLGHAIFFGRLETRKGLQVFCDAVEKLLATDGHGLRKVTFLGKEGPVGQEGARAYLARFTERVAPLEVEVVTDLDSFEAMTRLREANGLVVMPSLLDNYPFTVLECIENGLTLMASDVGGIPEMLDSRALFKPTVADLARALGARQTLSDGHRHRYEREAAAAGWLAASEPLAPAEPASAIAPRVSVCIAYYNYGKYLPQLLQSLAGSAYSHLEVIVVNDGSPDPWSNEVFDAQAALYASRGWRFLKKDNGGIGHTRNFAAGHATGEYLVFMDADNAATPTMLEDFVLGMARTGVDCLTCHFQAFEGDRAPGAATPVAYRYVPIGPCLEVGAVENVFGDANFCVRKAVFDALGGFTIDRTTSYEDWEFLATLSLKGYRQDVVPKPLFWYRHLPNGFSRSTNLTNNFQRVLRPYVEAAPPELRRLVSGLTMPMYHQLNPHVLAPGGTPTKARKLVVQTLHRFPVLKAPLRWSLHKARAAYRLLHEI